MIDLNNYGGDDLGYSDREAIKRFGFDIDQMNMNIREYRPFVAKIEQSEDGISVRVDDSKGMIPPLWIDYYMLMGDLQAEWNKNMFNIRDPKDMEISIYQGDSDVWEAADDEAMIYLHDHGYIRNSPSGYEIVDKSANRNVKSDDKYAQRRAKFGLGKKNYKAVKSRNSKKDDRSPFEQASSHDYPECPRCHASMIAIDMKFNDLDEDGNLYEFYDCPACGHGFTITYEGPDDSYDWWYDE